MAPSPYFFIEKNLSCRYEYVCRFEEIPVLTLEDIKETRHYRRMDAQMHGQR